MANAEKSKFKPEDVVDPKRVIHAALDWVKEQLIVGVALTNNRQAVLSSAEGLIDPKDLGPLCEKGKISSSLVTQENVRSFCNWLGGDASSSVDGSKLLAQIASYIRRYIVFNPRWADVVAFWLLGSYLYPIFQTYPYIWITSKEPGSGKTVLGQMIANLAFNGEMMVSPNETHLFRLAELTRGVQVWDEIESEEEMERRRFQMIKAVLLNGYRNGASVPRQVGRNYERTERFHVFCPRVLIGLSKLPEPVVQRTITLRMTKRTNEQEIAIYNEAKQGEEERQMRSASVLWALQNAQAVCAQYDNPQLRKTVEQCISTVGRETDDIWLPLFAVATVAFGPTAPEFLRELGATAKDLGEARANTSRKEGGWQNFDLASMPSTTVAYTRHNSRERDLCVAALRILEWARPLEPSKLVEQVTKALDQEVSTQSLAKKMKAIGIASQKVNGRRVFNPTDEEIRLAKQKATGELAEAEGLVGQQGQDGHLQTEASDERVV